MYNVKIEHHLKGLVKRRLPQMMYKTVLSMAHAVEGEYIKSAPKLTGSMASSANVDEGKSVSLTAPRAVLKVPVRGDDGAPYPAFNEFGTGMRSEDWNGNALSTRHVIHPRNSDAMGPWKWAGSSYYRKQTMGTYPSHAMRKALDRIWKRRGAVIRKAINSSLGKGLSLHGSRIRAS